MEIKEAYKNAFVEMVKICKYYEKRIKCPFEDFGCKFSHELLTNLYLRVKMTLKQTWK